MAQTCETSYSGRSVMTNHQIIGLISYDIIVMVCNFIFNLLVILSLKWSRQLYNPSLKLIMYLSMSDCCIACIVQPLFACLLFLYPKHSNCLFEMVLQFCAILFTHTSAYIIALIGYDRFARVKYMTKYSSKVTPNRMKLVLSLTVILSVFQASMYVIGTKFSFFNKAKQIAIVVDFLIVFSVVVAYLLAVNITRRYRKNAERKDMLKSVDKTITSLASKILLTVVLFYAVYVVISMVNSSMRQKVGVEAARWLECLLFLGYLLSYTNSLVNALIFLSVNKKARKAIRKHFFAKEMDSPSPSTDRSSNETGGIISGNHVFTTTTSL